MTGSVFILDNKGWACSNECLFIVERDPIIIDGKKFMKHTNTLRVKELFSHGIELFKDKNVALVLKLDDTDKLQGFTGQIIGQNATTIAISLLGTVQDTQQILNKIKEEI